MDADSNSPHFPAPTPQQHNKSNPFNHFNIYIQHTSLTIHIQNLTNYTHEDWLRRLATETGRLATPAGNGD